MIFKALFPAVRLPLYIFLLGVLVASCSNEADRNQAPDGASDGPRIVSLGGDVTEIVYALGAGEWVVGADQSSTYPPEVTNLARLNYHRQMSAEGILSLEPTIVLLTKDAGPPTAIEQLKSSGVELVSIPNDPTTEGVVQKIRAVAAALDAKEEGEVLVSQFESQLLEVEDWVSGLVETPEVIFLYARQGMGAPMVGGGDSAANAMIDLAGGRNSAVGMTGFKALTPESLLEFQPDCILMMEGGFSGIGGEAGLLALPGMKDTPAGKNSNFVTLPDDLILSYGPRTPEAIRKLAEAIHAAPGAAGE